MSKSKRITYNIEHLKDAIKAHKDAHKKESVGKLLVVVRAFHYGKDVFGNQISKYTASIVSEGYGFYFRALDNGGKRKQVGYGVGNQDAVYELKKLGYEINESPNEVIDNNKTGKQKEVVYFYPLLNL